MSKSAIGTIRAKAVKCEDCGAVFKSFDWAPGMSCPQCHGNRFAPVPVIGSTSEYVTADRSQGFALEDVRFGRLAQWAELVTAKQVQRLLHQQREIARSGQKVPDLGSMMVREKIINRRQMDALLAARCAFPGNRDDIEFGLAAVRQEYMTESQSAECGRIQEDAVRQGGDARPVPLIAYEKRFMREQHVVVLLKAAEQRQRGLLRRIHDRARAETKGRGFHIGISADMAPIDMLRLAGAILLVVGMIGFWTYRLTGSGTRTATVRCEACGAEGGRPAKSDWPIICSECGAKAMCPLAICLDCGEKFIVKGVGYGVSCPKCGSSRYKMLLDNVDVNEILAEIAARNKTAPGPSP